MAETLLRTFRFRVKLRRSAGGAAAAGVGLGAGFSAGAGVSLSAGASASASVSASASASLSASVTAGGAAFADGAFQSCSGLEVEMDVQEYLEGGRNDGVVRQVGRAKYVPVVLKRGMFYPADGSVNRDLWGWLQSTVSGERPVVRYDGVVEVLGARDDVVATWVFDRGLPARIRGPELDAKTGEIAIEELHIAHEGLRLEAG